MLLAWVVAACLLGFVVGCFLVLQFVACLC